MNANSFVRINSIKSSRSNGRPFTATTTHSAPVNGFIFNKIPAMHLFGSIVVVRGDTFQSFALSSAAAALGRKSVNCMNCFGRKSSLDVFGRRHWCDRWILNEWNEWKNACGLKGGRKVETFHLNRNRMMLWTMKRRVFAGTFDGPARLRTEREAGSRKTTLLMLLLICFVSRTSNELVLRRLHVKHWHSNV